MNYWVVLPAAGRGERFGGPGPKQYKALPGGLVIEHALAPFLQAGAARRPVEHQAVSQSATQSTPYSTPEASAAALCGVVVALAAADHRFASLPVAAHPLVTTTVGGGTRAESVLAGLRAVRERGGGEHDWVLVHDAARPCLGADELVALLAALATPAGQASGALLALPVADTVKRAGVGSSAGMSAGNTAATSLGAAVGVGADPLPVVAATVPREGLWRALTPQAFRLGALELALETALRLAAEPGGLPPTDEAAAIEAMGGAPLLVAGSPYNVKVTLPADLAFAATVLRSRAESSPNV